MSNKKNLLIYAHYYIPDTASTGQILRILRPPETRRWKRCGPTLGDYSWAAVSMMKMRKAIWMQELLT